MDPWRSDRSDGVRNTARRRPYHSGSGGRRLSRSHRRLPYCHTAFAFPHMLPPPPWSNCLASPARRRQRQRRSPGASASAAPRSASASAAPRSVSTAPAATSSSGDPPRPPSAAPRRFPPQHAPQQRRARRRRPVANRVAKAEPLPPPPPAPDVCVVGEGRDEAAVGRHDQAAASWGDGAARSPLLQRSFLARTTWSWRGKEEESTTFARLTQPPYQSGGRTVRPQTLHLVRVDAPLPQAARNALRQTAVWASANPQSEP